MPEVWKDIFRSGTYTGHSGEVHRFTPTDVHSAFRNGKAMLRDRIPVSAPGIWEHDWTATPEPVSVFLSRVAPDRNKRAAVAKNTFGWAKDYKLTYEPDPKAGGAMRPVLHALLTTPDAADLKQLEKVRFVSPRLDYDFRDTLGRVWKGYSVSHIAATSMPVQLDQRPVMLGRPASLKTVFLGGMAMAKDDAKAKDGGADAGGGDMAGRLRAICDAMGWPVPDGATSPEEVLLVMESHSMKGPEPDADNVTDPDLNGEDGMDAATPAGGLSSAMLSKLAPDERERVEAMHARELSFTTADRNKLLKTFRAVQGDALQLRVADQQELAALERRITGVSLSYTSGGDLKENGAIRELNLLVKAVNAKSGGKTRKAAPVRVVNLSNLGGNSGAHMPSNKPPQKPGDPGWDEAVRAATDAANKRLTGK